MKKMALLTIALCFVASLAFAQAAAPAAAATDTVTLKGTVIDSMCASAQKPGTLAEFVKTHTKDCAIKCADSGYNIVVDGKLYKFDKASNAKVLEFLKKADSKTQVTVVAKKVGEELSLVSIENQK